MRAREIDIEKRKAEIDTWNAEIDKLDTRIKENGANTAAQHGDEEQINALRQRRNEAQARLAEIQNASSDNTWEDFKDSLKHIWAAIQSGFKKVLSRFE